MGCEDGVKLSPGIVWTRIPVLSNLVPCIGHMGIVDSSGLIHDYVGGTVHKHKHGTIFGNVHRRHNFDMALDAETLDEAIEDSDRKFTGTGHNICTNNCHHHVVQVLNKIQYRGKRDWTQLSLWGHFMKNAGWESKHGRAIILGPWAVFLGGVLVLTIYKLVTGDL